MAVNDTARWADDGGHATNGFGAAGTRATGRGAGDVGDVERWAALVGGGVLAIWGLSQVSERDRSGMLLALMGGMLAWRGAAGQSHVYEGLRVSRLDGDEIEALPANGRAIRVERSVVVQRPATELWRFWRRLENLPRFMAHLESVLPLGGNRFHWTLRGPVGTVSWDAEIVGERAGDLLAWRSLAGSPVANAGEVRFVPRGDATHVHVALAYQPARGPLGAAIARAFGADPGRQVHDDLDRFRATAESDDFAAAEDPGVR